MNKYNKVKQHFYYELTNAATKLKMNLKRREEAEIKKTTVN